MLHKFSAIALLCGVGASLAAPALAQTAPPAPPAGVTAGFTTFLSDVLSNRVPPNISTTIQAQASQMDTAIKGAFASLGAFRRLAFVRQESMQGYHRYHYTAQFEKGSQGVVFVTDSSGTIVGFFVDQPAQQQQQPPPPES
jgi:hypothetical protein